MTTFSQRNNSPGSLETPDPAARASRPWLSRFAAALAVAALGGLLASCGSKSESVPAPAPGTNAAAPGTTVSPEVEKLVGKWQRPDGGYILDIKSVDGSGKLDAGYFNPNPINVSRAAAWREQGTTRVVIELRDVNYPGSTYNLKHDAQSDQLFGQYFQAALGQTFDVTFERMK